MIRRNIAQHMRDHDWLASLLDFVLVILGVFIALQANNWNQDRIERHAARTYIERIREDLRQGQMALLGRIAYYGQVKDHALAALAAFDAPKETLGEPFVVDAFQATQLLSRSIDRSTFDELVTTGAMNWIPDVTIRKRLANFYQNVAGVDEVLQYVPPYRENLRRVLPYPVQAAILAECDDITGIDARGVPKSELPQHCAPKLAPDMIKAAVAATLTADMKRDLVRRIVDIDTRIKNYQRLIDRGHALDQFLAENKF